MILNRLSPSKTRTSLATDTECPHRAGRPTLGHQEKGSTLNSVFYGLCVLRQVTTTHPPLMEKSRGKVERREGSGQLSTLHSEHEANSKGRQHCTVGGGSVVTGQSLGPGPLSLHGELWHRPGGLGQVSPDVPVCEVILSFSIWGWPLSGRHLLK